MAHARSPAPGHGTHAPQPSCGDAAKEVLLASAASATWARCCDSSSPQGPLGVCTPLGGGGAHAAAAESPLARPAAALRWSCVVAAARACVALADVEVVPLGMARMAAATQPDGLVADLHFPVYRLTHAGEAFTFEHVLYGGLESTPRDSCVALYKSAKRGASLVVKTLLHGDRTQEAARMARVAALGDRVRDCLVPAAVGWHAAPLAPGARRGPEHHTAIVMHHGGAPLTRLDLSEPRRALAALRALHGSCARLLRHGLAYVDLKLPNVLFHTLQMDDDATATRIAVALCDYGGLAEVGSPDAVATYPPPEHPRGTQVAAGARAVLYGLGVLLVHALTGQHAHALRFVPRRTKRRRDGGGGLLTDAEATELLRAECAKALADITALDADAGAVLRVAWARGSTMRDLSEALERALFDAPASPALPYGS